MDNKIIIPDGMKFQYSTDTDWVNDVDTYAVYNMHRMFANSTFTTLNMSSLDTSRVTNMYLMFENCNQLTYVNLTGCNLYNVRTMQSMFSGCWQLTYVDFPNMYGTDYPDLTSISMMFRDCYQLQNITVDGIIENFILHAYYVTYKNLSQYNTYSPFYNTSINIRSDRFNLYWTDLMANGWTF